MAAAGNGDNARRRELLLVVARCRTVVLAAWGVTISDCSVSDLSLPSWIKVGGVVGGGGKLPEFERFLDGLVMPRTLGVSGVTVISEISRGCVARFGNRILL